MTDCGCDKTRAELEEFLHNELESKTAEEVAEHIEHCAECTGERDVGVKLTLAVKRACSEKAPAQLRGSVLERIRALEH
jgi:anti-sigma factor (TIGR02949 family)